MSIEIDQQTKEGALQAIDGILPATDGIRMLETPTSLRIVFLPNKLEEIGKLCRGFGNYEQLFDQLEEIDRRIESIKLGSRVPENEDFETQKQAQDKLRAKFIALSALDSLKDTKEVVLAAYPLLPITVIRTHTHWMQLGEYPTRFFLEIFLPGEEATNLQGRALAQLKDKKKVIFSSAF